LHESSLHFSIIVGFAVVLPFLGFAIKVVITPKFLGHLISIDTELFTVGDSKFG
jgi:hypothetical protein